MRFTGGGCVSVASSTWCVTFSLQDVKHCTASEYCLCFVSKAE